MLAVAGKTAGPNGLIFWREPSGALGVTKAEKSIFFQNSTGNAGHFS